MYAVIETGGKQYRVEVGTQLEVELLDVQPGATITLDRVLLVADGDTSSIGQPVVADAQVSAEVVSQIRGPKTISFKYRPKARSRVKKGHRQELTVLRISDIVLAGKSAAADTKKAADAAKTERMRLEEAATAQAAKDAELAAKLAAARRTGQGSPRRRRRPPRPGREGSRDQDRQPPRPKAAPAAKKPAAKAKAAPATRRLTRRPKRRRRSPPAPPRRTSRPDGPQEGRRQRQERPR